MQLACVKETPQTLPAFSLHVLKLELSNKVQIAIKA